VARTIADLEQAGEISTAHVTEAATLRPPVGLGDRGGATGPSEPGNPRPT
jgi:hypothetical protein